MPTITIRNLDDKLKARLRLVAAQHGHTMEEVWIRKCSRTARNVKEFEALEIATINPWEADE